MKQNIQKEEDRNKEKGKKQRKNRKKTKTLRADSIQEMLATIQVKIFCLPVSCLKT
jgi:hypothetical protein